MSPESSSGTTGRSISSRARRTTLSIFTAMTSGPVSHAMNGKTGATESSTVSRRTTVGPVEHQRRKAGASGEPVRLADGNVWLLAAPEYLPRREGLTRPCVDRPLDRMFEAAVLDEGVSWSDLGETAREFLLANYELSDEELADLLSVSPGPEARSLAAEVIRSLLGPNRQEKSFTRWVRASLLANGLAHAAVPADDLLNVLAVLVATNRTVPLARFADACRLLEERARLEVLI